MKKRLLAFLLSVCLLLGMFPPESMATVSSAADTGGFVNYGAALGSTARFNIDSYVNFLVFSDPSVFDYDADWDNDDNWVYHDVEGEQFDIESDHQFVIRNYYYDEETTALWYQVKAAPGYQLPEKMAEATWVFQNFAEQYQYEDWETVSPDSLIVTPAQNYVFDSQGNPISRVSMGAYDEPQLQCATSLHGKVDYQWQIRIHDEWVDIAGENNAVITLNAGMLISALTKDLTATVRCITRSGSKSVTGEPIPISVTPYSPEESTAVTYQTGTRALAGENEDEYRYVTVRYLFESGVEAANPFLAKVLKSEPLNVTIEFPTVQGYLPYYQDVRQDSLTVNEASIPENITYTVYYKPTDVEYSIDVYFQNTQDDNYTFQGRETLTGLTGSKVPHLTVEYEGMYELLHETPDIAANGSTHLEVYFNRVYYLTRFELDGGHGVYPIYARYGSGLADHVGTPVRPGYTFVGWDDITSGSGDGIADVVPETVPAREQVFEAIWKENPTAEVRIAFWGENPNDEGYSYIESQVLEVKPGTVLTYGTSGNICGLEEHTHGNGCTYDCGLTAHTHTQACYALTCNKAHSHTDACYTCNQEGHTHSKACYPNVGNAADPWWAPDNPEEGEVYNLWGQYKYIYIKDTWYSYSGNTANGQTVSPTCGKTESTHTHSDACLGCGKEEHSHTDYTGACYTLTCTQQEHTHDHTCTTCLAHQHSDACVISPFEGYDATKWTLVESETVTVEPDGSTVMNVKFDRTYFTMTFKEERSSGATLGTIYDKWGADIRERFKAVSEANTFFWSETSGGGSPWTSFMDVMPAKDMTFYSDPQSGSTTLTAKYYGQKLGSTEYEELYSVSFKGSSSITVSKEEFVDIEGYIFNDGKSSNAGDKYNGAAFYYDRASFTLEFYSGSDLAREESMLYEESFKKFVGYEPDLPSDMEPGSRRFVGWYLNPECTGEQVDLSKMTMPAENMALYAKWELVTHQVNIYKERFDDGTFGDPVLPDGNQPDPVLHGHKVFDSDFTLPIPENPPYSFIGWFYMNGDHEQMWDFEHTMVIRDTDIYAKWSAEVLVPYTVRFIVQNTDGSVTQIADPISSSALAGTTVTFSAKAGLELYSGYQQGYFPLTTSHSLTMDVTMSESGMSYDFVYVARDKVPYTVRYVDSNGNDLIEPKVVANNTYAIVTEKFVYIQDYSPDKYQKTLVLNGAEGAVNEIVFHYKKDATQGVYNVTHYIRSTDGVNYIEHTTYGDIGTIGDVLKIAPLELRGFTYDYATVNGVNTAPVNGTVNGTISREGLEIKLYYERNKYPYKIQYLDVDTLAVLKDPDIITPGEYYGTVVTKSDPPTIENYTFSSVTSTTITIDDPTAPTKNVVNIYYSEQSVRINYKVVGPDGCGTVDPQHTDVKVLSGSGATSTATAAEGFRFVGWYSDKDCTQQISTNATLFLTKPSDGQWKAATYYAKFEPFVSDLTIVRTNTSDVTQVYVYEIKNNATGEIYYATITGNGTAAIKELPMGEYTVTQQNDWSWRHDDPAQTVNHQSVAGTFVVFEEGTKTDQWLNGNSPIETNTRG